MLFGGIGTTKSIPESLVWMLKAGQEGDAIAQHFLGDIQIGLLSKKNPEKAFGWYLKAAKKNYARSQMMTGMLLFQGRGVAQNNLEGAKWMMLSLNRLRPKENQMALRTLKQRFGALSPDEQSEVPRRMHTYLEGLKGTFPKDQ